jgi:hypothetical protein
MTIPLKKEPDDFAEKWGSVERCHFCLKPTRYWHENTNNPVCQTCSKVHKVMELPDHGQRIRANKRRLRKLSTGALPKLTGE